ncbi:hypothetical protein [Desulfonema magnum]|uniref:hypothetical protein n=1 Tax=Desulfonema magnum TaxID=45655 RepID=UPI001A9A9646|nr:hypothetical protein [Desulfonema magnum]
MPRRHEDTKVHEVTLCPGAFVAVFFAANTPGACPKSSSEPRPGKPESGQTPFLAPLLKDMS